MAKKWFLVKIKGQQGYFTVPAKSWTELAKTSKRTNTSLTKVAVFDHKPTAQEKRDAIKPKQDKPKKKGKVQEPPAALEAKQAQQDGKNTGVYR